MEHVKSVSIFLIIDHIVDKIAKDREALFNDVVKLLSVFIKLKLVPGS